MKALLLCGGGANQTALANRLHAAFPLYHIALVELSSPRKLRPLLPRLISVSLARPLRTAWRGLMRHYGQLYKNLPAAVPVSRHASANASSFSAVVDEIKPDLVLVSGTDLLKKPIIDQINEFGKVMNLHTGLSPYIKGGPNCTNWALSLREFDAIGNTIMWIDPGIDSGSVIATERTPLKGSETLLDLHIKVMDHAHDLYCRAYQAVTKGVRLPSIPQSDLAEGRLFLNKHWDGRAMLKAVINFILFYKSEVNNPSDLRVVPLERF